MHPFSTFMRMLWELIMNLHEVKFFQGVLFVLCCLIVLATVFNIIYNFARRK